VRYTVILTDEVKARLHALPLALRREIGHKLFLLEEDLTGNVKKAQRLQQRIPFAGGRLSGAFALEGRTVTIYAVGNRKDIYR
jgi:mRNA-degrading endonuclease RelE of RelBE toxin-antitoxin system